MICSMTAFARTDCQLEQGSLVWEIKSVNHRYLEISPRLPDGFRDLESPLREKCRQQLGRGKVEINLRYQLDSGAMEAQLDTRLLDQLITATKTLDKRLHHPAPISPGELLRIPGVLVFQEPDLSQLRQVALEQLDLALKQLIESRQREGAALASMIEQRLDGVLTEAEKIRQALPGILDNQRERLKKRLEEVITSPDSERLEQELVLLAQKMDVAEEIDRLEAHVTEVRRNLNKGGYVGRRLDFLMQELNREANTLGSKSIDTRTTQAAVELKVLIEQMREQVQNIE